MTVDYVFLRLKQAYEELCVCFFVRFLFKNVLSATDATIDQMYQIVVSLKCYVFTAVISLTNYTLLIVDVLYSY